MKFRCDKCGNSRYFHHDVTIVAKERVSSSGKIMDGKIFDKSNEYDGSFYLMFCSKCGELVGEVQDV